MNNVPSGTTPQPNFTKNGDEPPAGKGVGSAAIPGTGTGDEEGIEDGVLPGKGIGVTSGRLRVPNPSMKWNLSPLTKNPPRKCSQMRTANAGRRKQPPEERNSALAAAGSTVMTFCGTLAAAGTVGAAARPSHPMAISVANKGRTGAYLGGRWYISHLAGVVKASGVRAE
jgi:hypothetical protein